ncbi:PspA/IM30 family protein [Vallitalea okinawensis]|uniref:PspA/IM30 family protein n=1 Tax=Vallitalea okinawensis TaxID=2078660 RepID=UPI000CFC002F|nr:PspA/IM30 family protein [Vallitalea okinawensis]
MGIFKRLSNLAKAKANNVLDDLENPIEMLDLKIKETEERLHRAKVASAQVLGNTSEIKAKRDKAHKEMEDYLGKAKIAKEKGTMDLARKALVKKMEAERQYNLLKEQAEQAEVQAEELKTRLKQMENELGKLRQYRDEAVARMQNAEASEQVNSILVDLGSNEDELTIDAIERKISKKENYAIGLGELREESIDEELAKLDLSSIDDELEKL